MTKIFDVCIIGGGINGVGIAADAASRGLSVLLCEQEDFASATSSASSKLIHGGLRYLENYQFRLVKESLAEREILLKKAPHLIKPLKFVIPLDKKIRSPWLIRIGLRIYDYIATHEQLPFSGAINLINSEEGEPLKNNFTHAFYYFDCQTNDARLVLANALAAKESGAYLLPRHKFFNADRKSQYWEIFLKDISHNTIKKFSAKALVNAAGPWVNNVLQTLNINTQAHLHYIKGSHIVLPKLYLGDYAYLLQQADHRVVFVIPFENNYSLIGTTDVPYQGDPKTVSIDAAEKDYLCNAVNQYFKKPISLKDIVWSYSGVRTLYDRSTSAAPSLSRDYAISLDAENKAPLLSILGGKLTTYRKLSEQAINALRIFFPAQQFSNTKTSILPGGNIGQMRLEEFLKATKQIYPWLNDALAEHYVNNYGSQVHSLLSGLDLNSSVKDLGQYFGGHLYQKEIEYLIKEEWAQTAEDILWRRTKQGLLLNSEQQQFLSDWLSAKNNPL